MKFCETISYKNRITYSPDRNVMNAVNVVVVDQNTYSCCSEPDGYDGVGDQDGEGDPAADERVGLRHVLLQVRGVHVKKSQDQF